MHFPVEVTGSGNIWKAVAKDQPKFFAFGESALDAVDIFQKRYGMLEKLNFTSDDGNFNYEFHFHVTRVLDVVNA